MGAFHKNRTERIAATRINGEPAVVHGGVLMPQSAAREAQIGGIACNLFKRLGGTDAQWVDDGAIRDKWTAAVDDLLRHVNGVAPARGGQQ